MSEIEKMKRYIKRTNMKLKNPHSYAMNLKEAFELALQVYSIDAPPISVISLAFDYGQAKGYRAAKAEGRKGATA